MCLLRYMWFFTVYFDKDLHAKHVEVVSNTIYCRPVMQKLYATLLFSSHPQVSLLLISFPLALLEIASSLKLSYVLAHFSMLFRDTLISYITGISHYKRFSNLATKNTLPTIESITPLFVSYVPCLPKPILFHHKSLSLRSSKLTSRTSPSLPIQPSTYPMPSTGD